MKKGFSIDQRQIGDMSFPEIIGSIFIRSQALEQLMRQLLESNTSYTIPRDFEKRTFGQLLIDFARVYPNIKVPKNAAYPDLNLHSTLENARDIRNDAAHGYFLIGYAVAEILDEYASKVEIDRYNLRMMQKSLMAVDMSIMELLEYVEENKLLIDISKKPNATN